MTARGTPSAQDGLVRIIAPHFVAGVVHDGKVVTRAAPILHYMVGWSGRRLHEYCLMKAWGWERVP